MTMPSFTIRQLLESGVHFGHHTRRWNPKMTPYIFGVRNNIHIINLEETVPLLSQALSAIREVAALEVEYYLLVLKNLVQKLLLNQPSHAVNTMLTIDG